MTDSINQSINNKGVYRTAPATPGLLKMELSCQMKGTLGMQYL